MTSARARRIAVAFAVLAVVALATSAVAATADGGGWQAGSLDLSLAWQVTRGSPDVTVAIVDTGVQADHPALRGRVLPGIDLVHGGGAAVDDNGHGTALAGIVSATCPLCSILPVKVLDQHETGDWSTIAAGVRWAADHGAEVINLSVGGPRALDVLGASIAYALAKGAIVVAAAGNDGRNEAFYPAQYPGVVSVAGVDQTGTRYSWSNFGSWVTVAAPGCATTSWLGGGVASDFCGTSTAAPFVAGIAGLALAYDPALTPAAFAAALAATSTPTPDPGTAAHGLADAGRLLLQLRATLGPPALRAPPRIPHAPRVGTRLVAAVGTWQRASATSVQWQRSRTGTAWHSIASGVVYVPQRRDVGYELRVVVTARNDGGTSVADSTASAPTRLARR